MTTTAQQTKPQHNPPATAKIGGSALMFRGFDDWVEIFKTGTQTDSQGRTKDFTNDDLDSMVANHQPTPIVIGHPETDAPAWGWSTGLKREGNILLAKYSDVNEDFEELVEKKTYPNRSVKIRPVEAGGYELVHTGFLGGAAPAVKGLKQLSFNDGDDCLEFSGEWYVTHRLARLFRGLKNYLISEKGQDEADRVLPEYDIDSLSGDAVEQRVKEESDDNGSFTQPNEGDHGVGDFTQEDLDKAVADAEAKGKEAGKAAAEQNFSAQNAEVKKLTDAQAKVGGWVKDQKLTPALAIGMPEFMANLAGEDGVFEFSSGEGANQQTVKQSPIAYFSALVDGLSSHGLLDSVKDDGEFSRQQQPAPVDGEYDQERYEMMLQAEEYAAKHEVSFEIAVAHFENGGS